MNNQSLNPLSTENIKIAYIHSMSFPNNEANAFDAIWTAAALSNSVDVTFIVKSKRTSKSNIFKYYYILGSSLRFRSLLLNWIPDSVLLRIKDYFEKAVLLYLRFHPSWAGYKGKKVLYARNPKTLRYIGLKRKNSNWLHNWILIYESHDPLGFSPTEIEGKNPFEVKANDKDSYPQQILEASRNFDAMICNTKALADDIQKWTKGEVTPNVINIASPLPRLENPPKITFGEKITIGYIGTIDQFRGVDILLESLKFLPENYMIRLVGRFRQEPNVDPNWLGKFRADASNKNRLEINILDHIADVKAEIDRCDILVQTASQEILDSRYATPQKSYGYMMRGKPIVVGNVPCHHEIFTEGVNAVFYNLNPKNLADTIINLVNDQSLANRIAIGAWFLSADYSFAHRASKIFHLVDSITKEEKNNKIR